MREKQNTNKTALFIVLGTAAIGVILFLCTIWMGRMAQKDTESAVRSVSLLYLDELAGRREQVVADNLRDRITDMQTALELLTEEDLKDKQHLESYQSNMKRLFKLERFAFVDEDGLIYTSTGTQTDIDAYPFDYRTISGPEISILNLKSPDKKVIIAMPVDLPFEGRKFVASFMQIDMAEMLSGVSMQSQEDSATFCNIYTSGGVALSDTVLGGLAVEDNLLEALQNTDYEPGYSYAQVADDFANGNKGQVSFTYNDIRETLSYVPVGGTDWMLTYLIRESVISGQIQTISDGIIRRSLIQSAATVLAMLAMFFLVIGQIRRNARLSVEKETSDAENRVKRAEMEQRLALQDKLLEEQKQREEQRRLITALCSDYWSVYYIELDEDDGVCYQEHTDLTDGFKTGEHFSYLDAMKAYAEKYVTEPYREEFMQFVQPASVKERLRDARVIAYTYMVERHGREAYEMVRFAAVRRPEDHGGGDIHSVGACFTDVDRETREAISQQQTLSDALAAAEQANKAKTAFLSNMSHEIRTPMNAIIGLDNIAMNDPETTPRIRNYLKQINSSAEHLLKLINDILDMSRIESGRLLLKNEEFSFHRLLEATNTIFSAQCADKGVEYQCYIDGQVDDAYIGDDMKLRQVLINILGNAVKFTPEGGTVKLGVKRMAQFDGKTTLQFTVTDTGVGIDEEFLPHIFDAFAQEDSSATNKYGSSGLGLAITKSIVEMMNGNIHVESEKGKGSTFIITVTLMDAARKDGADDADNISPQNLTVLVIDDDPIAQEHAKLVLAKAGIYAETASSGQEAIDMVQLRQTRMEPYNLILVDWKMPEMDGVETTRRIRSIVGNESAIIILTAYHWDDILDEATLAGVDSFLAKPLFAANVMEEFKTAIKRKGVTELYQKQKADLTGRRVLLAEDVDVNAEIMLMLLETRQIEAERAENGKVAVEKFSQHPAGYYDAILMDVRMPEMDGLEATRVIRSLDKEDAASIPIIALTANAFDEDVQRSLQAGLNAHLSKPIQPEILFATLEDLIEA